MTSEQTFLLLFDINNPMHSRKLALPLWWGEASLFHPAYLLRHLVQRRQQ
ncbi:MAG: hypothetical protein WBA20_00530 [Ketobacter sp.]